MAARRKKLAKEVVGVGRRRSSLRKAIAQKAIDRGGLSLKQGIRGADLIIIATPVDKVIAKIKESAIYAKKGAIIIDVNSAKETVVDYADRIMPGDIFFVGTHPIAGLEESGVLFAKGGLFEDTLCVITPTRYTGREAFRKVRAFWRSLGARIKVFDPKTHDKVVAEISHLPHILSYSLCNTVSAKELKAAGSGFKDTTRIARSDPNMWLEIFIQNDRNILNSIKKFEDNLSLLKSYIRKKSRGPLLKRLCTAQRKRNSLE